MRILCPICNSIMKTVYTTSNKQAGLRLINWIYCYKCDNMQKIRIVFEDKAKEQKK